MGEKYYDYKVDGRTMGQLLMLIDAKSCSRLSNS